MNHAARTIAFCERMWRWFEAHRRTLPWRDLRIVDDTQRAYRILVSEVMLQQTQVPRVEIIFKRFIEQFPTIQHLAAASNKEVIIAWKGMGYNSRALRVRDAARTIVEEHEAVFPREMDQLLKIKGIGPYTAAAIRNFAFLLPTACIDTNIRRIVHRVFVGPDRPDGTFDRSDKELLPVATQTLRIALEADSRHTGAGWHAALMDFGSAICKKSNPLCTLCPMAKDGLCKSAFKVNIRKNERKKKSEPGRLVGSVFVPNRIFRGRIIDALREAHRGLTLEGIGSRISIDWNSSQHREWLQALLDQLIKESFIVKLQRKYKLSE